MKIKYRYVYLLLSAVIILSLFLTSCSAGRKSDQEKLAEIVQDRFIDIDQFAFDDRALSLDEAEAYLYCWAEGEDVSDEELREAIYAVLESTDLIRELISEIDEIDVE